MERNKALEFSEKDVECIQKVLDDFSAIAKDMGVDVSTDIKLTSDRETIEIAYATEVGKFCQYYKKSIICTWKQTLNEIKAGLFGELRKMCF